VIDASKEVNANETKYILLFHYQNAGQSLNISRLNRSFENEGKVQIYEDNSRSEFYSWVNYEKNKLE
jgi:hypothetical protein